MASYEDSTIDASLASASCARLCSVMSRATPRTMGESTPAERSVFLYSQRRLSPVRVRTRMIPSATPSCRIAARYASTLSRYFGATKSRMFLSRKKSAS